MIVQRAEIEDQLDYAKRESIGAREQVVAVERDLARVEQLIACCREDTLSGADPLESGLHWRHAERERDQILAHLEHCQRAHVQALATEDQLAGQVRMFNMLVHVPHHGNEHVIPTELGDPTVASRALNARSLRRVAWVLDGVSSVVPKRVADEELGDALEAIKAHLRAGGGRGWVFFKVWSTVLYVLAHGIGHFIAGIRGKKTGK